MKNSKPNDGLKNEFYLFSASHNDCIIEQGPSIPLNTTLGIENRTYRKKSKTQINKPTPIMIFLMELVSSPSVVFLFTSIESISCFLLAGQGIIMTMTS